MKKRFSVLTVGIVAFLMLATSVYAMVNWEGTENVGNIKDNLGLIQIKINTLKEESGNKDQTIREIEILLEQETALRKQKEGELQGKQTEIQNKQQEIQNKIDEINQKITENNKLIEENNQLKEKANQVDGLKAEVENLKKNNEVLTTDNNSLRQQLDQALKDVKEIEQITESMISN